MTSRIPRRLREGHPTWADQLMFRLAGLGALGGFAVFLRWLCRLQATDPRMAASPMVLLACLGAVVLMHLGTTLTLVGPELLHEIGRPVRRCRL